MKIRTQSLLLIFVMLLSARASAELYRGVDAEGNVVYSDRPFESAEKYTPPPISVVDAAKAGADEDKVDEGEKPAEFRYMAFDIVSPKNNETIRNEPDIAVSLQLKPGLNVDAGHSIWLLANGKPVVKNSQSMQLRIGRLDRGAYKLQGQIRDAEGKVVVRTREAVIFVHQGRQ